MRAAATLLMAVFLAAPLEAQIFDPYRQTIGGYQTDPLMGHLVCGSDEEIIIGAGASFVSCTQDGAHFEGAAETAAGLIHARSAVSGTSLVALPGEAAWSMASVAGWGDRLEFSGAPATTLVLTANWTGTLNATLGSSDALAGSNAMWRLIVQGQDEAQLGAYTNRAKVLASLADGLTNNTVVDDTHTMNVPIAGMSFVDVVFFVTTNAHFADVGQAPGTTFGGSAESNFFDTGKFTGLAFLDAEGNDVTSSMTYTFLNGGQVYQDLPGSVVPEPSTYVLLASGLLVLAAVGIKQRPADS